MKSEIGCFSYCLHIHHTFPHTQDSRSRADVDSCRDVDVTRVTATRVVSPDDETLTTTTTTMMAMTTTMSGVKTVAKTTTMRTHARGRGGALGGRVESRARESLVVRAAGNKGDNRILRENEKEAWLSEAERDGENPLKDPMALIGIGGIMVPFIILAVASAAGFIGQ